MNIVPSSISYCASVRVQYDTLRGTIFTNIHAITLLLYSNKYFFFGSVINTVKIWFFNISLLYCTRMNILIFALVQYEWHSERTGIFRVLIKTSETNSKTQDILIFALVQYEWHSKRTGIFSGSYKDDRDQQKKARIYCTIFYTGLNREIFITI